MVDNELLTAFISEMDALRVHGRDFARTYPDVASRLDIGAQQSADAQVERVIQATAFLAARLRLMIERNATELPLSMLSMIAPALVEPVPSFALLQLEGGSEEHEIKRHVRFDARLGTGSPVCLSTTMGIVAAPLRVMSRRLPGAGQFPDGIGVRLLGVVPQTITLCLGKNERTAAALLDAFVEHMATIEVVREGGGSRRLPTQAVRVRGFTPDDAALPVRPATHPAHRVVTEFLAFPNKFRFISVQVPGLRSGDELRFRFLRPIALPTGQLDSDVIGVNMVPVVNLWPTVSSPIDVDGRRLEYPVRAEAVRYRRLECHSVESVDIMQGGRSEAVRLDPVHSLGALQGTSMQWGTRRSMSRSGSQLYMYFRGLDYGSLGRRKFLATGNVLASNQDMAAYLQAGAPATAVDPSGGWRGRLANVPTPYLPGLDGARALETMIGYLNSGMVGFIGEARRGALQDYLKRFPAADRAPWIDGLRGATMRPVMVARGGRSHAGVGLSINFEAANYPNTSKGIVKRVLGQLFESQRGLNRVEQLTVHAD